MRLGIPDRVTTALTYVAGMIAIIAIIYAIANPSFVTSRSSGLFGVRTASAAELQPQTDDLPVLPFKVSLDRVLGGKCVGVIEIAGPTQGYRAFPDQFTVTEFAKNVDPRTTVIVDINHGACYTAAEFANLNDEYIFNRYQAACLGPLKQCMVLNLVVDESGNPSVKPDAPSGNLMPPPPPADPVFRP